MAGQGATSPRGISSYGRRNQSLYATEMHLSPAWTSLLWFHGVWYGLSLFSFHSLLLCLSWNRWKNLGFQTALHLFQKLSGTTTTAALGAVIALYCTCASRHISIHMHKHASVYVPAPVCIFPCIRLCSCSSAWILSVSWYERHSFTRFSSEHRGPICISLDAEQMWGTAVGLRCPLLLLRSGFKLQHGHMSLSCPSLMWNCRIAELFSINSFDFPCMCEHQHQSLLLFFKIPIIIMLHGKFYWCPVHLRNVC